MDLLHISIDSTTVFCVRDMYPRDRISSSEFVAHATAVNCVTIGPKSLGVLASGGDDFKVNVWKVGSAQNIWTLGYNKSPISCVCFDSDERNVVSGAVNGSIKVFDLNVGKLARALGGHQVNTSVIQYHPHGEFIVSGSTDCTMKVWDVRNKTCLQTYTDHEKEVTCVRFSPDGRWVASSAKDGQLIVWNLVAGKKEGCIKLNANQYISCFEFSPVEFVLAAATNMRTIRIWDLETWETITSSPADSNPPRALAFNSDGGSVYYGTKDFLKSWSWQQSDSNKAAGLAEVGWDKISELKVSEDNKLIAVSYASNFVSVWSADLNVAVQPTRLSVVPEPSTPTAPLIRAAVDTRSVKSGTPSTSAANVPCKLQSQPPAPSMFQKATYDGLNKQAAVDLVERQQQLKSNPTSLTADEMCREISRRINNGSSEDTLNSSLSKLRSKWGNDDECKDMATSIGESFWKRFKEEREKARLNGLDIDHNGNITKLNEKGLSDAADGGDDDNDDVELDSALRIQLDNLNIAAEYMNNNEVSKGKPELDLLRNLLPPSKFETNSNTGEEKGRELKGVESGANAVSSTEASSKRTAAVTGNRRYVSSSAGRNSMPEEKLVDCVDLISKIGNSHSIMGLMLTHRLSALRSLRRAWDNGNIDLVCEQLKDISAAVSLDPAQVVVAAEFLGSVDLKSFGVTLDQAIFFLNFSETMLTVNNSSEVVVISFIKSATGILIAFKDLIKTTRSMISVGAVDISREERLQKCNVCFDIARRIKQKFPYLLQIHRRNLLANEAIRAAEQIIDSLQ